MWSTARSGVSTTTCWTFPGAAWNEVDVPAVKNGRVVPLFLPYLTAPSPRVQEALDALAKAIAPR